MRLAARVLLPGTCCVAFVELMDLVCLMMDLSGKSFLPRRSLAFFDFPTMRAVCEATISFKVRRPVFSRIDFEDTLSLREVYVIVRATDLIDQLMFSVAKFPGFPSQGVHNRLLFKVKLLVLSNYVLPEREIQEMFY